MWITNGLHLINTKDNVYKMLMQTEKTLRGIKEAKRKYSIRTVYIYIYINVDKKNCALINSTPLK